MVSHTLLLSFAFLTQQQNVLNVFPSQQIGIYPAQLWLPFIPLRDCVIIYNCSSVDRLRT